jgi:DNA primase
MRAAEGRMDAWKSILPRIERIHDKMERLSVAKDMAEYLRIDESMVLEQFRRGQSAAKNGPPRTAKTEAPPIEKLLLNALLKSDDARAEIAPALMELEPAKRFVLRNIFDAIFAIHASGDVLTFSNLEARLSDSDKDLLSRIVFADEGFEETSAPDQARDCLRVLQRQHWEVQRSNLKSQIQDAERRGDLEEALRLSQGLPRLDMLLGNKRGRH